ncbi:MAG: porin [Succinivibrionaceae bacterium]
MLYNYLKNIIVFSSLVTLSTTSYAFQAYDKDDVKVDVNVLLHAGHYLAEGDNAITEDGTDTFGRLTINGSTKVNDFITGFGTYEGQYAVDNEKENGTKDNLRLLFGGLKFGDYGAISFGRQKSVTQYIGDWTDNSFSNSFAAQALGRGANKYATQRTNDLLKYQVDISNLTIGLNYKFDSYGKEYSNDSARADAKGALIAYKIGDVQFGTAYTTSKAKANDVNTIYSVSGLKYDNKKLISSITYAYGKHFLAKDIKHNAVEAAIIYKFDFNLDVAAHYEWRRAKEQPNHNYDVNLVILGTQYRFNKNIRAGIDYRFNTLDDRDNDAQIFARLDF